MAAERARRFPAASVAAAETASRTVPARASRRRTPALGRSATVRAPALEIRAAARARVAVAVRPKRRALAPPAVRRTLSVQRSEQRTVARNPRASAAARVVRTGATVSPGAIRRVPEPGRPSPPVRRRARWGPEPRTSPGPTGPAAAAGPAGGGRAAPRPRRPPAAGCRGPPRPRARGLGAP